MAHSIIQDTRASGFGALLILFPFILSVVFTGISYAAFDDKTGIGAEFGMMYTPANYTSMTRDQIWAWLNETHGGPSHRDFQFHPALSFPDFIARWYTVWPDGFKMDDKQLDDYLSLKQIDTDWGAVAVSILTINPPMLEVLGWLGVLIRILLVVSIAIGLTEILWIGG